MWSKSRTSVNRYFGVNNREVVFQALLPANVDNLANVLNRLGVGINGFANNTVDKLKKTCLPKQVVTLDFYSKNIAENDDERSIARAIYQQI